jgi:hypothetical protein
LKLRSFDYRGGWCGYNNHGGCGVRGYNRLRRRQGSNTGGFGRNEGLSRGKSASVSGGSGNSSGGSGSGGLGGRALKQGSNRGADNDADNDADNKENGSYDEFHGKLLLKS